MASTFNIRSTAEIDVAALQAVEISASQAFKAIDGLASFAGSSCATMDQHRPAIEAQTSWLAETVDGNPVGFLAALPEDSVLHIFETSVHYDHQKQGIGQALLAHAEEHARSRGLSELTLTTFRHVPWNAPFYEKLGFEILADEDCEPRLLKLVQDERSAGLPFPEKRCAMRKILR